MYILSIDVGMLNLGLVYIKWDGESIDVEVARKIDLTRCIHRVVPPNECTLYHTNAICDRVAHFFQEWEFYFVQADIILMERQPPMGLKDIEALIQFNWRSKVHMISPQSMHKHFRMSGDYDMRKIETTAMATPYLLGHKLPERKHDIADAVCMFLFWKATRPLPPRKQGEVRPFDEFKLY